MKYQHREQGDDRCSHPKCRRSLDITYLAGATPLNPDYGVQLCDDHHEGFCELLRSAVSSLRETHDSQGDRVHCDLCNQYPAELSVDTDEEGLSVCSNCAKPDPKRISVKSFVEGMWS